MHTQAACNQVLGVGDNEVGRTLSCMVGGATSKPKESMAVNKLILHHEGCGLRHRNTSWPVFLTEGIIGLKDEV